MISVNWTPKSKSATPVWEEYQHIPSVTDEEMCCLAMNREPWVALFYNECNDDIASYELYGVFGGDFESSIARRDEESFRFRELAFCMECTKQLEFIDLSPPWDLNDRDLIITYVDKFKTTFYQKYYIEGWSKLMPKMIDSVRLGLYFLAQSIDNEKFLQSYKELFRIIQENRVENGGELKYLHGSNRIRFIDFVKWADQMDLTLPSNFPEYSSNETAESNFRLKADKISAEVVSAAFELLEEIKVEGEPEPMSGHPETQIQWILYILMVEEKMKPGMLPRRGLQREIVSRAADLRHPIGETTIKRAWKKAFNRFAIDT